MQVVRARFFSHTKWATFLDQLRILSGLGQNAPMFTWPPTQPQRPHRGRSCTHGGSPGRRPTGPTGCQLTGQFWVCRKMARRELASLSVSKMAPANWSDSSVSKIYHSFSRNRRKQEDLRFSKMAPAAQHPPANWSKLVKTGRVMARRQLAGFEGVENLPQLPR